MDGIGGGQPAQGTRTIKYWQGPECNIGPVNADLKVGRRELALPLTALAIFACRAVLGLALIPPWQQPDEPTHLALVELRRSQIALLDGKPDPAREGEILSSMARHEWWKHRGRKAPEQLGARFVYADVQSTIYTIAPRPAVYYRIAGELLSWLPRMSVADDLHALRVFSASLSMLTILVAWLGARECLGAAGGATVALLLALHPQFVVASTAVSADAMVSLLGATVWWQAAVALRRNQFLLPTAAMWVATFCAALTDRSALPLLVMAFAASVAIILLRLPFRGVRVVLAVLVTAALTGISIWLARVLQTTFTVVPGNWFTMPVSEALNFDFFWRFSFFLLQSWWSSLGWVRYAPPPWWVAIAFVLVATATVGAVRRLVRERDAHTRALLGLAVTSLAVHLFAVYWAYFRLSHGAQGKSLFPVLVPSLILLWIGVEAWVPAARRAQAAVALVVLFALLDAAVWSFVTIPAYANS